MDEHQQLSHHKQSFSFSHLFYYLHKTTRAPRLQTGSMYLLSNWKRNLTNFPKIHKHMEPKTWVEVNMAKEHSV